MINRSASVPEGSVDDPIFRWICSISQLTAVLLRGNACFRMAVLSRWRSHSLCNRIKFVFQSWPKPINHARFACNRNEFKIIIKGGLGSTGKLGGEVSDRLRVHLALVPFLEDFEVRAPGFPVLAALPTIAGQEVR